MSKGEVLNDNLHLARLIHGKGWRAELESWFHRHAARFAGVGGLNSLRVRAPRPSVFQ